MKVLVVTTVFTCLSALAVGLRLWTRFKIIKSPGLDDFFISLALVGPSLAGILAGSDTNSCSIQASAIAFYAFVLVGR